MRANAVDNKIVWIGTYPSHYMRKMHRDVEQARPGAVHFVYLPYANQVARTYERGDLPASCDVLDKRASLARLYRLLGSLKPQSLLIAGYGSPLLLCAYCWAWLHGKKYMYYSDTNLLDVKKNRIVLRWAKWIALRLLLGNAQKLLYIGSRNRDFYAWVLGSSRANGMLHHLPYPAILNERSDAAARGTEHRFHVLYLGRLEPVKGVENLLRAVVLLPADVKGSLRLSIAGSGSEAELLTGLSRSLGIDGMVAFLGPIASNEVADVYRGSDLFVLPSAVEPWGLVVNEALSAGLPVLCPSWIGAAADLIIDGETGFIVENNTPEALARGIERAFRSRGRLGDMGRKGASHVRSGPWHCAASVASMIGLIDHAGGDLQSTSRSRA